jgi:putative FmdB family regulatory protein
MPVYEYECTECGWVQDEMHGMKEEPTINCKMCKGKTERTIAPGMAAHFKGPGFYENDYKQKE